MALLKSSSARACWASDARKPVYGADAGHLARAATPPGNEPEVDTNENWTGGDDIVVEMYSRSCPKSRDRLQGGEARRSWFAKPADADIDEALKNLAESAQNFETKKGKAGRPATSRDRLPRQARGRTLQRAARPRITSLVLGSQLLIPGFEEKAGRREGGPEEKSVDVTFPEEYGAEHLAARPWSST